MSQEPVLFNCSIKENIIYGIEDKVNQADIEKAAQTANIHDFIQNLPHVSIPLNIFYHKKSLKS